MNVTCLVFTQKNAPLFHNRISTLSNFSAEPNHSNYATYSSRDDPTTKTPALHSSASNVRPTHCWLRYSALQISPLFPTFSAIISLFFVRFRVLAEWNGLIMRTFVFLEESLLSCMGDIHLGVYETGDEPLPGMQFRMRCSVGNSVNPPVTFGHSSRMAHISREGLGVQNVWNLQSFAVLHQLYRRSDVQNHNGIYADVGLTLKWGTFCAVSERTAAAAAGLIRSAYSVIGDRSESDTFVDPPCEALAKVGRPTSVHSTGDNQHEMCNQILIALN